MRDSHIGPIRSLVFALAASVAVMLAGCAGAPTPFAPASPNAGAIANLAKIIFGIAGVVFVVVETLLIYSAWRFSRKRDGEPTQIEGNSKFEVAWTLAPAIVLAVVFVVSLQTLTQIAYLPTAASAQTATTVHVRAIGHQWFWEFDYPDLKFTTANEMHVPLGAIVSIDTEAVDVIHSFWVPQLAGKTDAIPGHINHMWFQPTQIGTYHGQCAEFCGIEHANMRFQVVVESAEQFQTWVKGQQAPVATMTGDAVKGEQIFLQGACVGCHTVNGTKAIGKVGPNLTHLASRKNFAGAILENTPQNLALWLQDPQKMKPGTLMPRLNLSQADINALVAYLTSLK